MTGEQGLRETGERTGGRRGERNRKRFDCWTIKLSGKTNAHIRPFAAFCRLAVQATERPTDRPSVRLVLSPGPSVHFLLTGRDDGNEIKNLRPAMTSLLLVERFESFEKCSSPSFSFRRRSSFPLMFHCCRCCRRGGHPHPVSFLSFLLSLLQTSQPGASGQGCCQMESPVTRTALCLLNNFRFASQGEEARNTFERKTRVDIEMYEWWGTEMKRVEFFSFG